MFFASPNIALMLRGTLTLGVGAGFFLHVAAQDLVPDPLPIGGNEGASINGPGRECEPYYHAETANSLASFPPIWDAAKILPDDANAQAKWASIQPNIPNTQPKGTPQGDFSTVSYTPDDPDCWWTYTKCNNPKVSDVSADISIMNEPHTLGYGFDDGPNCSHNAFYDYLKSHNQKATMFFIGSNVMDWPLETARAVTDGHEICVHSWSHRYMTSLESSEAFAELYYSMQAIKLAAGVTPTCWRPPFGDVDDRIRAIASGLGLRTVLWAYDSQDWQVGSTTGFTPEQVDQEYELMIADANNGAFNDIGTMILMHELNEFTMNEAMKYYPKLKAAFKNIVPVATGLNITHPYVEDGYVMQSFAQYLAGPGAQLIANGTNSTASTTAGANGGANIQTALSPGSTNQVDNTKKTGDASRMGIVKVAVGFSVGFMCASMMGLLPH